MPNGPNGQPIEGLRIGAVLKPDTTWRARDEAGRRVVLKKLPDDCLLRGKLHPAIAQRLLRLREAPVANFGNLIGVQKTEVGVVIVSEWVSGQSFDQLTIKERRPFLPAARRLVESLHRTGLVHGAIGAGNFIVDRANRLHLIDPSPFLYEDFDVDWADLERLDPDELSPPEAPPERPVHGPSMAAAVGLSAVAIAGAAGWALHVAGRL